MLVYACLRLIAKSRHTSWFRSQIFFAAAAANAVSNTCILRVVILIYKCFGFFFLYFRLEVAVGILNGFGMCVGRLHLETSFLFFFLNRRL